MFINIKLCFISFLNKYYLMRLNKVYLMILNSIIPFSVGSQMQI